MLDFVRGHPSRQIGLISSLALIGGYFVTYWVVADIAVYGPSMMSQFPSQTVSYRVGDYELGDWSDRFFAPAAYVDRKVLRRSLWCEDLQPPGGGTVNAWKYQKPGWPFSESSDSPDYEELNL